MRPRFSRPASVAIGAVVTYLALKLKTLVGLELTSEQQEVLVAYLLTTLYALLHRDTDKPTQG